MAKFYSDIDLLRNQAKGLVLETHAGTIPASSAIHFDIEGQVIYDSSKDTILICTSSGNAGNPADAVNYPPVSGTWKRLDFADNSGTIKAGIKLTQPSGTAAGFMEMDFSGTSLAAKSQSEDSALPVDTDIFAIGLTGGGVRSLTMSKVKTFIQSGRVSLSGNTSGGIATGTGSDNELSVESTLLYSSNVMSIGVGTNDTAAGIKRTARITSGPAGAFTITGQDQVALGAGLSTDRAGGAIRLYAGKSTGDADGGAIVLKTAGPAAESGDGLNALSNTWTFGADGSFLTPGTIKSNSNLVFQVDADSGEASKFSFLDGGGTEVMALNESGNLSIAGSFTMDSVGITGIETASESASWADDDVTLVTTAGIKAYIDAQNFGQGSGNTTNGVTSVKMKDTDGTVTTSSPGGSPGDVTLSIRSGGGAAQVLTNTGQQGAMGFVADGTDYATVTTSGGGSGLTVTFSSVTQTGGAPANVIATSNAGSGYSAGDTFTITPPNSNYSGTLSVGTISTASHQVVTTDVAQGGVLGINVAEATTSATGVAKFNSSDFSVTSGDVTIATSGVSLTSQVSGTLPVANGGTGATTLEANGVLLGSTQSAITASAALTFASDELKLSSTTSAKPGILLTTSDTTNGTAPYLDFEKTGALVAAEDLGKIRFFGGTTTYKEYSSILGEAGEKDDEEEFGRVAIKVLTSGGSTARGLVVEGTSTTDVANVTLGFGSTSQSQAAGKFKVTNMDTGTGSLAVLSNSGVLETRDLGSMAFADTANYSNNDGTVTSVTAGTGLDVDGTAGSITETGTLNLVAGQTGISSIYNTSLKIGNASSGASLIDFSSSSDIAFYVNDADQVKITDGTFEPVADNDIVLGSSTKGFSGLFVNGTIQPSTVADGDGAVQRDLIIKAGSQTPDLLSVDDPGGALKLYGGMGTGNGAGGNIELHVYDGDAGTGSDANGSAVALTIDDSKKATFAGDVGISGAVDITGNTSISGNLTVTGTTITQNETVQIVTDNTIKFEGTDLIGGAGEDALDLDLTKWTTLSVVEPTGVHNLLLPAASDTLATETFVSGTYAPLASPDLTGSPTSVTVSAGDDSTAIATTAFVQTELTALGSSSSYYATIDIDATDGQAGENATAFADTLTANITHSLGSNNLLVQLWEETGSGEREEIFAKVTQTSNAVVKVKFSHMPGSDVHVSILKIGGTELTDDANGGITYSA